MRRLSFVGAAAIVMLTPILVRAQTTNTLCWMVGNTMQCSSQSGVVTVPNYTAQAAQQFANGLRQVLVARRQAQALEQLQEANAARERAQMQLFTERARDVLAYVVKDSHIEGPVGEDFIKKCVSSLDALYRVNPTASQLEMVDVILPHFRQVQSDLGAFIAGYLPPYQTRLQHAGATLTPERRLALAQAVSVRLTSLYMNKPSASASDFGQVIDSTLAPYEHPRQ